MLLTTQREAWIWMISKKNMNAVVVQLPTKKRYQKNLDALLNLIDKHGKKDLIVAPEVLLTGYDYDNIEEAARFSADAVKILKRQIDKQILVLTILKKDGDHFINQAIVIHNHKIVHRQNKVKLFRLGDEHKYLESGDIEKIKPFKIDGVTYALLICFELRFKDLWKQIEGAEVIIIPARWGLPRKLHLEILSKALAVMNQAFVILSNSSDKDMASSSAIISPNGITIQDDSKIDIRVEIDFKEVKTMRRYIVID